MASMNSSSSQSQSQSQSQSSSSSSGHSADSLSTVPIDHDDTDYQNLDDDLDIVEGSSWGILTAVNSLYKTMELKEDIPYKVGRALSCQYRILLEHGFDQEKELTDLYTKFSKVQFIIYKEEDDQSEVGFTVYIKDTSTNGIFVNGEHVKGASRPLLNCSKIAIAMPDNEAFIFINVQLQNQEFRQLPRDFNRKYVLENVRLGEGATGVVKRGHVKTRDQTKVAVKIIRKGKSLSVVRDLTYEASLMQQIHHANVVKVKDVFDTDHAVYIVLECVNGGELFDYVKQNGAVPEDKSRIWFLELLEAVDYLHSKNIIHRDLKPENVLLTSKDSDAKLKITDFGLSRMVAEQSLLKTLVGTSFYLAPEIVAPTSRGYTSAVDLWSLGCILFIMLAGYPPFSDEGEIPLNDLIRTGNYTFHEEKWRGISVNAKKLVKSLLTVNVADRITLSAALSHPWFTARSEPLPPAKRMKKSEE